MNAPFLRPLWLAGVLTAMNAILPPAAVTVDTVPAPTATPIPAGAPVLTIVNPPGLYDPSPNGYSHAVVAQGGKRVAYIAGQGGEDPAGTLSPLFAEQLRQAFANLGTALAAAGARPDQVAKLTTYVVGYEQSMLPMMTKVLKDMFGDALPAQTLVPVPRLALDGMLFEVDAVAVLE